MAKDELSKVINSHVIQCLGANIDGKPVFIKDRPEPVVIKVYESGITLPLCRYHEPTCVAPRCNPKRLKDIDTITPEDKLGVCPYSSR